MNESSNADWVNDQTERKSILGGFITYNRMSMSWTSRKQKAVTLSMAEDEYRAMTEVMQWSVYGKALSMTLDKQPAGIKIENDNMPVVDMLKALAAAKSL